MTSELSSALDAVWREARRSGALGSASTEDLQAHSAGFAAAVIDRFGPDFAGRGIDIGTGAGVPGVFVALRLPQWDWVLVDSSARRCEFADAAVGALSLRDRVFVRHGRADELPAADFGGPFDAVTARLFGPPPETVEVALSLARKSGVLVASVRETDRSWWETLAQRLSGVSAVNVAEREYGLYATVVRGADWETSLPRRAAARRRRPLA